MSTRNKRTTSAPAEAPLDQSDEIESYDGDSSDFDNNNDSSLSEIESYTYVRTIKEKMFLI